MNKEFYMSVLLIALILVVAFGSAIIASQLRSTNEILSTTRSIASEARDAAHVQNCYLLNDDKESFEHCVSDWLDYQNK